MFRSSTIIRELALNLAEVIYFFKTFGEIRSLFIMQLCGSMSRNGVCVACCAFCTAHTHKYNFSQVQCKLPDDGRRPKHVGAIFTCILM